MSTRLTKVAQGRNTEAVSSDNIELAREFLDAVARRDLPRLLALTDPEVEWRSFFALGEEGGVYRGHDAMQQYVSDLSDAWEIVRPEPDDGVAVGDVAVLVGRVHYRGKASGVETESAAGWMFKFRDGKVFRCRAFREPEEALEATGVRE
jgi:ketosteroid isomerase-like protein